MDRTRRSWNIATRNHNAHKGDQAAFLRGGGDTLFAEERELLGDIRGSSVVHLQCNSGQDSLCLGRLGGRVVGVDFSDEAIRFARALSSSSGLAASFEEAEVVDWMARTEERFDVAFCSYGATGWLPDLDAWARGVARVLKPGGRLVYVEFHPVLWSVGADLRLSGDDYFASAPFRDPVGDYVAASGAALLGGEPAEVEPNEEPAVSYQHTLAALVSSLLGAGLRLTALREYPYANGCKVQPSLVLREGRRWHWPDGAARLPLMFGLTAAR